MAGTQGSGVLVGGAVVAGLAGLAALIWALQPVPEASVPVPLVAPVPDAASAPVATAVAPQSAPPEADTPETAPSVPTDAPLADTAGPGFDTVRVTPEGEALVAGRAAPGAAVALLLDGAEAARAEADAQGNFVALFTMPPSAQPRLLSLLQLGPPDLPGQQTVALAPVAGPQAPPAAADPTADRPEGAAADPAPPPVALLVTDQGATVLQAPPAPGDAADTGVSIDAISYTPDGAVQLSGRGSGGAGVRLYLDTAPVAEALVAGSGQWFATLRDVAPRLYTLRADQIGADGKVTARFETPFLRETPQALAAALKPQAAPGNPVAQAARPADTPSPSPSPSAAPTAAAAGAEAPISVTVQPGFTLWRIARENFGDGVMYVQVFEANKAQIRDPDLIYPGQVFTIPKAP